MKTGFIGIIATAALLLGSTVSAEQITPVQKKNEIVSTQGTGIGLGLGGLGAAGTAALIGTIIVIGGVVAGSLGDGGTTPTTAVTR